MPFSTGARLVVGGWKSGGVFGDADGGESEVFTEW